MALQDLLDLSQSRKKVGLSEERVMAIVPAAREYIAFWREYPDMFVDFLVHGYNREPKDGEFKFYFYQRVFLRSVMRFQYVYAVFPRAYSKSFLSVMALMIRCILYPGVHLFVTSGAGASKHALKTLKHALISWGGVIIGENQFSMGAKMDFNVAQKNFSTVVNAQMKRLYQHLKLPTPALFSLVGFRIQKKYWTNRTDQTTIDYLYWKEKGWLENSCHFYTSIQIPFYKRIASSIISQLVGLIMLKS